MPVTYSNHKGITYYLCEGVTKTGKSRNYTNPAPNRGAFAAIYTTVAAVFATALLTRPELFPGGRWIAFSGGALVFVVLADRTARLQAPPPWLSALLLILQAMAALALIPLSNYYFMMPLLTFITVSESQIILPRRWANVYDAALLGAIAATYGLGFGWGTMLQVSLGYGAGFVFIVAFTQTAQRERRARQQLEILYQHLDQANRQLAEYAGQVERLATARERNRLAREVHDSLGHYLTVISVQLEIVTKLIGSNPNRAGEAAARAKELASEGLSEVRRSVAALRPSPLDDQPLPQAIRGLADTMRDAGLIVSFEQVGAARPLSPEIETVLYRAAQESLTNVRKHAHASSVNVQLAFEPETVRVQVRDNGIGRQDSRDGVGLMGLRERVAALDGSVRAENHPDGGFVVEVMLPCGGGAHG